MLCLLLGVCFLLVMHESWLLTLRVCRGCVHAKDESELLPPVSPEDADLPEVDMCTTGFCEMDELTSHVVPRFWQPPYTAGNDEAHMHHAQTIDGHPTILVMISAYRDFQCPETIAQAFLRSSVPQRVLVAAVEQRVPLLDRNLLRCVPAPSMCKVLAANASSGGSHTLAPQYVATLCGERRRQLRTVSLDASHAEGPTFPRHVLSRMYRGEAFVLQVDAHTHFVRGWDASLLTQWHATGNEYAVISAYPTDVNGSLTANFDYKRTTRPVMCSTRFERGMHYPRLLIHGAQPEVLPPDHLLHTPMLQPFWAAGFSFARGHWVRALATCCILASLKPPRGLSPSYPPPYSCGAPFPSVYA